MNELEEIKNLSSWQGYKYGFKILTKTPSKIVQLGLKHIPKNSRILDLGCGGGRNSIFAAKYGYLVNAIDINPLSISNKDVNFTQLSVNDLLIPIESYQAIIATRLIQYLDFTEINNLFEKIATGLTKNGVLMLNYTASGGITEKNRFHVATFSHKINDVIDALERNKLKIISLDKGNSKTKYVPYDLRVETYDILAKKE